MNMLNAGACCVEDLELIYVSIPFTKVHDALLFVGASRYLCGAKKWCSPLDFSNSYQVSDARRRMLHR